MGRKPGFLTNGKRDDGEDEANSANGNNSDSLQIANAVSPRKLRKANACRSNWLHVAKQEFVDLEHRISDAVSTGSSWSRFRSPALWRMLLRAQACYVWFPKDSRTTRGTGMDAAMSYVTASAPKSPALAVALDASGLINLGTTDKDERMVLAGRQLYGDALRLLRSELTKGEQGSREYSLGTIMVLQTTEWYNSVSDDPLSWRAHSTGVESLVSDVPDYEEYSSYGRLRHNVFITFYFWDALLNRRNIDNYYPPNTALLNSVAQRVPGALANCDALISSIPHVRVDQMEAIFRLLQTLEDDLQKWTVAWSRSLRDSPYHLVPSDKLSFVAADDKKANDPFPLRFSFQTLADAMDHTICIACLFSLKTARLQLVARCNGADFGLPQSPRQMFKAITDCADNICMSLPCFCTAEQGTFGPLFTIGALHLATT